MGIDLAPRGSDRPKLNSERIAVARNANNNIVLKNSANCYQFRLARVRRRFSAQVLSSVVSGCGLVGPFEIPNEVAHMNIPDSHTYLLHTKQTVFQ